MLISCMDLIILARTDVENADRIAYFFPLRVMSNDLIVYDTIVGFERCRAKLILTALMPGEAERHSKSGCIREERNLTF